MPWGFLYIAFTSSDDRQKQELKHNIDNICNFKEKFKPADTYNNK